MTLEEFLNLCKSRDWPELFDFLHSSVQDLSTKILATAVIGVYHPDKDIANNRGLKTWTTRLSAEPVPPMLAMMTGAIGLESFAVAYLLAQKELNDKIVADSIAKFVKENKNQLGQYLNSDKVSKQDKDMISELFGELGLSKKAKEAYFKKTFVERAQQKIAFIQTQEKIKIEFGRIFHLEQSDFRIHFSTQSSMHGIKILSSEGNISFKRPFSNEMLEKIEKTLKSLDISANFFDMSWMGRGDNRGIQLFDQPHEVLQKLLQFEIYLADEKSKVIAASQKQGFFKAAEAIATLKQPELEKPPEENKISCP